MRLTATWTGALCMISLWLTLSVPAASSAEDRKASDHGKAQSDVSAPTGDKGEIAELKRLLEEQQGRLLQQQKQLEELRQMLLGHREPSSGAKSNPQEQPGSSTANPNTPALGQIASTVPMVAAEAAAPPALPKATGDNSKAQGDNNEPLAFHIGSAYITPVGFMDFTSVWRSTAPGTGIGTNFGSIPFGNTSQGNLTELRFSTQNSRIGSRIDAIVKGAHVIGYWESDFLGLVPGNTSVSSNSNSFRLRLYWVDLRKDKWEILGGQSWSMLTPGRKGISPLPSDIFYSQDMDVNYQLGLTWARDPQFRFVFHPSEKVAIGLSLENPEQYIGGSGGGGLVTIPSKLVTPYASMLDNGGTSLSVPGVHPDVVAKIAFDPKVCGRDFHIEFGGTARTFKVWNPLSGLSFMKTGGAGQVNLNLELFKGFHLVTNNYWGDGGGRYIFGQSPDLIVRSDGSLSPVRSGSTVSGFEYWAKNSLLFGYYGGVYISRNVSIDASNGNFVGYGYPGSPNGQNRTIQEATFGINQTFWKNPRYGALSLIGQYSYLTRNPWAVAAGQPASAKTNMVFLDLRYTLPGSAPKIE